MIAWVRRGLLPRPPGGATAAAALGLAYGGGALGAGAPAPGLLLLALGAFALWQLRRPPGAASAGKPLVGAASLPEPRRDALPASAAGSASAGRTEAVEAMAARIEAEADEAVREVMEAARDLQTELDAIESSGVRLEREMEAARGDSERGAAEASTAAASTASILEAVNGLAGEATRAAATSREVATRGEEAQRLVSELSVAAGEIRAVTKLIAGIAGQTNLLALNATIEAARAGEAGKGFAVVAGEVKQLAAEAAKANSAISERIGAALDRIAHTSRAMDTILAGVREIAGISAGIEQGMASQAETASRVARAAEDAAGAARAAMAKVAGAAAQLDDNRMSVGMMHGASGQVAAAISGLQGRLAGVVRASIAEGDRRRHPRLPVRRRCSLLPQGGGEPAAGQVANLSLGGVKVFSRAAVAVGDVVELSVEGLPSLKAKVVGRSDGLHLAFLLGDAAAEQAVQEWVRALPEEAPRAEAA